MSRFDRFMVYVDIGTDEKLARLTDAERLCHIAGVLALAAKSPIRGRLLVGDLEASPREVGRMAAVSDRVARSTIDKLVLVGVLVRDEEYDCWRVHNWEVYNPEPKTDATSAERSQRYRDRRRDRDGNAFVTPAVTAASRRDGRDDHGGVTAHRAPARAIACARSPEGVEVEDEEQQERAGDASEYPVTDPLTTVNDERLRETVTILRQAPRLQFDLELMGVALILSSRKHLDHVKAATNAAARAIDPTYRTTDAATALRYAFDDLERQQRPRGGSGSKPAAKPKPWAGALRPLLDDTTEAA